MIEFYNKIIEMNTNKIVVLDGFTANPGDVSWHPLAQFGELKVYDRTEPAEVVARCGDASIILTNKVIIGAAEMSMLPSVRYIGVLATGYNNIDVAYARERGITVTNVPAYSTEAVAQHVFALILALFNRVEAHNKDVINGGWQHAKDWHYTLMPIRDLAGKALGIYGLGAIGSAVARIGLAFNMRILATRRHIEKEVGEGILLVDYPTLLAESDILSLHAPLTEENRHFISKETLAMMKAGSVLINTGRGGLVDEFALASALKSGKLSGAAVDVLNEEPPRDGSPLIGCRNCLITPHIAWASVLSRERLIKIAAENIEAYLQDKPENII